MGGFVFERMIPSFTNLVFLFMMVSGFGMCCGYYQKFKDQKIGVVDFYKKRYSKIWPYFALLCVLDFVMSPSKSALYEVFANLTLCQGLLPNMNISVIGVSWTLAVIFVFYLLFPLAFAEIGSPVWNSKRIIVEDDMAQSIVKRVLEEEELEPMVSVEFYPGGCSNLKKYTILTYARTSIKNQYIIFDGDQCMEKVPNFDLISRVFHPAPRNPAGCVSPCRAFPFGRDF